MSNKHRKRQLTSLVFRETQIKATARYHNTPIFTVSKIKKDEPYEEPARMWRNWNSPSLVVRPQNGTSTLKKSLANSQEVKRTLSMRPHLPMAGPSPREKQTRVQTKTRTQMFPAALFVTVKTEATQIPTSRQRDTFCSISTMELSSAKNRNGLWKRDTMRVNCKIHIG